MWIINLNSGSDVKIQIWQCIEAHNLNIVLIIKVCSSRRIFQLGIPKYVVRIGKHRNLLFKACLAGPVLHELGVTSISVIVVCIKIH
jgi:hypothetical protein